MKKLQLFWDSLKQTAKTWNDTDLFRESASIAYYAIFSIPGLLIIIMWVSGFIIGEDAVKGEISDQISSTVGNDAAKSIQEIVANVFVDNQNIFMKIIGIFSLVFGATTLFFQLQVTLNNIWKIEAAPKKAIFKFLLNRANSLGMILVIGFLMIITTTLSSFISFFNNYITKSFGLETYYLMQAINFSVGFLLTVFIFAFMFKVLPDIKIKWKSVIPGAFLTALLFTIGKFLLNYYFVSFKPASAFGTAGTIILIMMWVNYSCVLFFLGALFTKNYSLLSGDTIEPTRFAKWKESC
ncbi:YihY/virulence factor BrkB family protein [Capnocytophaga sp. ARDL2]|uniref:YihY/virulence factor BrkB family protein n=1 Tax=Capnocytophaga sp. ARDL2 TaxID=3238809 RepID=UPI0035580F2D